MLVDARDILLTAARVRVEFAVREYLSDDLSDVEDEGLRAFYLRNRLTSATNLLADAVGLVQLAATK